VDGTAVKEVFHFPETLSRSIKTAGASSATDKVGCEQVWTRVEKAMACGLLKLAQ
jgi:hypothetical protein